MKKIVTMIILLFCVQTLSFAQNNTIITDSMLFISIDIRSKTNYPIVMNGIVKNNNYITISRNNVDDFISNFYSQAYYVPNFLIYDNILDLLIETIRDTTLVKYIGQGQKIMNLLTNLSRKKEITLKTGEHVFIEITQISGLFYCFDKTTVDLPTVSIDIDVNDVEAINFIYIPLRIDNYKKICKTRIERIFK